MKSFLIGYTSNSITADGTAYNQPVVTNGSANSWSSSLSGVNQQPLPHAITLDRLRVKVATAPGTGKNLVFTILKNGVATALTCTISGAATTAQDLSHTVSFAAGDTITMQCTLDTGGTPSAQTWWTTRQDATGNYAVLGSKNTTATGIVAGQGVSTGTFPSSDAGTIIPCAGTISNLYVNASGATGTITINKNGTGQTVTIVLAANTGNDTTHSFSVAAGDRISINNTVTGRSFGFGFTFAPTTDGNSFIGHADNGHNTNNAATAYYQLLADGDGSWDTTETNTQLMLQACTLTGIFSQTQVSPGVAPKAYAFTARQNAADTAATVTINDASASPNDGNGRAGNLTGQSITIADDDLVDVKCVPTSTPSGLHAYNSILINVASSSSSIKTVDGLAKASVKTVEGLAIASVKTWDGLA